MKQTLKLLFEKSVELGEESYTPEQINAKWIGNAPALQSEIEKTEKRLGITLPSDYVEMLTVANGFPTSVNSVEPSFQKVEDIDFYKNYEYNAIETWKESEELEQIGLDLERAIMIAGKEEEQQFLIIPPTEEHPQWKYWKFALWNPGEEEHQGLKSYLNEVINFLTEEIQGNN